MKLTLDYNNNIEMLKSKIGKGKSYDVINRNVKFGNKNASLFFIDGFVKDESLQNLIQTLSVFKSQDVSNAKTAKDIILTSIQAIEVSEEYDVNNILKAVLSGQTAMIVGGIEACILIDYRTYPSRGPEEPDKERTLRGSRDGFVETIVFNSALIRRRIRDPDLIFEMITVGKQSKTDVAIAYIENRVEKKALNLIKEHLNKIEVDSLTLGNQSLIECLNKKYWYNPMPKVRFTERPDVTSSHLLEGKIVLLVDNNPYAMLLPTSIFDFLQDVDDYYSPIITCNYLRFLRNIILLITLFITPIYLLMIQNPDSLPEALKFLLPSEPYNVPVLLQFFILEFAIDGLRLASLNTPTSLSMSLSVVGALILGEYTVSAGWFIPQTILYMAVVALASFTQKSIELSYGIKFFRMFLLITTALFDGIGLIIGSILCFLMLCFTKTFTGEPYLYPLIPFNLKDLIHVLFRTKKKSD